jgi:hypothetical protein
MAPMAASPPTPRLPVWLRLTGVIVLVLVGVLAASMLLAAADVGETSEPPRSHDAGNTPMTDEHGGSDAHGPTDPAAPGECGGHGS